MLTEKVWEKLYGVLWKLKDYEDTGLMPNEVTALNAETQKEARKMAIQPMSAMCAAPPGKIPCLQRVTPK